MAAKKTEVKDQPMKDDDDDDDDDEDMVVRINSCLNLLLFYCQYFWPQL